MLEKLLSDVEKPGRYVGGETNACRKAFDSADVHFLLAFPDVYEVGLSHLGLRLLYHALNGMEGVMADRAYAPWLDFEQKLRATGEPLRAVESRRPFKDFDFLGFSLQYELSYTNILTMLDLGGIPLEAKDRTMAHPWVIAGGPCAFNPEPLADYFDCIVLGEAEQVLPQIVELFREWKAASGSRSEFLSALRRIEGIYVPSFFDVAYEHPEGRISRIEPRFADYTRVKKRLVPDLDASSPIPQKPLVPLLDIVHNRLGLEIARGCTRGCRFCQAGFIYRPVRERDPEVVLKRAQEAIGASGFEEVSLLSLSTGDYCQIQPLLASLMERFASEKVAVAFPSMRVGTLTPELMELVRRVRKTGFTLAPEAGSERLRQVINKPIVDSDLLCAAQAAFGLGWRVLKLYFMTGLPTESQEDLDALVELCFKVWKLAKTSRSSLNVSVSTFVPKPHTPFQWEPQPRSEEIEQRLEWLRERLKRPGMRLKWNDSGQSLLEAVFARGDRRLGGVLRRAWQLGARFDGWTEKFRFDLWQRAFEETGLDPSFYAHRRRTRDEVLPWDHLSSGVEKEFLWQEYERALSGELTPDCRHDRCSNCGVCDHGSVKPELYTQRKLAAPGPAARVRGIREEHFLYWFRYSKLGRMRLFGQLEIAQAFSRAVRRSELPAAFSEGFHPHVKLSFVEALPLGFESQIEEAYVTLTRRVDPEEVRAQLNRHLPEGIHIEVVEQVARRFQRPEGQRVTYRISELVASKCNGMLQDWSHRLDESLVKKTKRGEIRVELKDVLLDVRRLDESSLEMDIYEDARIHIRPTAILRQLLGESTDWVSECRICKVACG